MREIPQEMADLTDDYLSGIIDEPGLARLEAWLADADDHRAWFVRYSRMHTDLAFHARANRAMGLALTNQPSRDPVPTRGRSRVGVYAVTSLVGMILVGGLVWWFGSPSSNGDDSPEPIAWLINAQDCTWAEDGEPRGGMHAGEKIRVSSGWAEFRFRSGAEVLLEGPAILEPLAPDRAQLHQGRLTARIDQKGDGFTVITPHGKVIDLGTEFGVAVDDEGATQVHVFDGKVMTESNQVGNGPILLDANQGMTLGEGGPRPIDPADFRRRLDPSPPPRPRRVALDFRDTKPNTLRDADGRGTGLTHRLPGTGTTLPEDDPNLSLDPASGRLQLTTTDSDLNRQRHLETGEYLGFRLTDHGFTGAEDFSVSVEIADIPALQKVGQFGLYAGSTGSSNVRGGLISIDPDKSPDGEVRYTLFLVRNREGHDEFSRFVGLVSTGDSLRMTLRRAEGRYAFTVENLTDGASYTLAIPEPDYLTGQTDFYAGFFGANTRSRVRKTLFLDSIEAIVWTRPDRPDRSVREK